MRRVLILGILLLGFGTGALQAGQLPAVRLLVSNPAPFVGEEVIVTLEIRTTPRPPGPVTPLWPTLDNCAVSDLPSQPTRLEEGAPPVLVQTVRRAVRPFKTGRLTLERAGMRLAGEVWSAPALALRVQPLPQAGRPEDFSGAIGAVTMTLQAIGRGSREIQLFLSGAGPLDDFPVPLASLGSGERLILLDDALTGAAEGERIRTLRFLYLPGEDQRGQLSFRLPLFDPRLQEYRVLTAGIHPRPVWPRWMAGLLGGLFLLAGGGYFIQRRRAPRNLDQALTLLLGRPAAALPRHEILVTLERRGATEQLRAALTSFWEQSDRRRFAPDSVMEQRFSGTKTIEASLLRQLRKLRS